MANHCHWCGEGRKKGHLIKFADWKWAHRGDCMEQVLKEQRAAGRYRRRMLAR